MMRYFFKQQEELELTSSDPYTIACELCGPNSEEFEALYERLCDQQEDEGRYIVPSDVTR